MSPAHPQEQEQRSAPRPPEGLPASLLRPSRNRVSAPAAPAGASAEQAPRVTGRPGQGTGLFCGPAVSAPGQPPEPRSQAEIGVNSRRCV